MVQQLFLETVKKIKTWLYALELISACSGK